MDKPDAIVIIGCLLAMLMVSCVINDPCAERNQPHHAAEGGLCE